ncbi:MAG: DUF4199 domain-containing protein [Lewinella sp.]
MQAYRIEIKWALLFTAMMLVWVLLERLVGLHGPYIERHALYTNLVAVPAFLIYCLALREKRDTYYQGTMTYRQGLICGAVMTVIIALLSPLAQLITHTLITPRYFPNLIEYAVSTDQMSRPDAQAYFRLDSYMLQSAVASLFLGLLTTGIVAIFFRKPPSEIIGEPLGGYE